MITSGTVLLERDAPHPQCFHLEDGFVSEWLEVSYIQPYLSRTRRRTCGPRMDLLLYGHFDQDDVLRL